MGIKIHQSNHSWHPPHNSSAKVNKQNESTSLTDLVKSQTNFTLDGKYHGLPKNALFDNLKKSMEEQNCLADLDSLQAKLTIGQPGDKYEQEADRVAEQVMKADEPVLRQDLPVAERKVRPSSLIRLSSDLANSSEEESIQAKAKIQADLKDLPINRKIRPSSLIRLSSDLASSSEEESIPPQSQIEDRRVEELDIQPSLDVQRMDEASLDEGEEELISPQSEMSNLSLEEEEILQTKKSDFDNKSNTEDLETKLNNSKGGGSPLPETTKGFMESRFGADFSDVKIHDNSTASSMSESISAQAFTTGSDIYFNTGKYSPDSNEGKSLLAHELTHVLQQRGEEIAPLEKPQLQKQDSTKNQNKERETEANTTEASAPKEQKDAKEGIKVNPPVSFAVSGSTVTYYFDKGEDLAPNHFYEYRWKIHNDKEALERYRSQNLLNRLNFGAREVVEGPSAPSFEVTWDLVGKHTIICHRYTQGKLTDTYRYVQEVKDPVANAFEQFDKKAGYSLQPDVYLAQLELRKEILEKADPQKNAETIKQLDEAIVLAKEKLGVSDFEPVGNSYPLKALLVPKDVPDSSVPLQLYLRRVGSREQWEIVDLTNPAPDAARKYSGSPNPSLLPGARERDAIKKAWQNFLDNTPSPAGQIVAELPTELSEKVGMSGKQRWNGYSNGISGYQQVRQWLSRVGFGAGLGAIALTLSPIPGSRAAAAWLLLTSGAAAAGAGALNIADKLEHGNFQWKGETYLDLVDIVGGLAVGTSAGILLRGNAAKVTQLQSAILISESVETS
ncbi:MAG: DUF4157 domain-containing protein, partial [Prochloraceae cyanobacterium]